MTDVMVQLMITVPYAMSRTERAPVVMMMVGVAVMPIPVMRPACVVMPPVRVIIPVPGTGPRYPCRTPEPIVDNRPVHIYRFDDIVRTIHVFVTDHLNGHIVLLVFLHVDGRYILVDILG